MTRDSKAVLHPVCFGTLCTRGNKIWLPFHIGEGFSGDYAINKCRSFVFGQCFVWVTDCYAIKFIRPYKGGNPAILHMQMRPMCWDIDIVHCPNLELVDVYYWSRLGVDMDFDPLFREYLELTSQLCQSNPTPTDLPMQPENMPYYRGPRFQPTTPKSTKANTLHIQSLLTDITTSSGCGHTHLLNVPLCFGELSAVVHTAMPSCRLLNSKLARYAWQTMQYDWAVYSFLHRHFLSTIKPWGLSFTMCLACNTTKAGCSFFTELVPNATVFSSRNDLLNHIRASGEQSIISGYLINS